MIKVEIKHKNTGEVLKVVITNDGTLKASDLVGAYLSGADLTDARLTSEQ